METRNKALAVLVILVIVFAGLLSARDGEGGERRGEEAREGRRGEVAGFFVRLMEKRVGDQEVVGVVVKPRDRDEPVVLLVRRENEAMLGAIRRLREGQRVEAGFERGGEHMWVARLESVRTERSSDGERRVEVEMLERRGDGDRRVEGERRIVVERRVEGERRREGERRVEGERRDRVEVDRARVRGEEDGRRGMESLAGVLEQMARQFRELAGRVQRMEREMRGLRAENERLRRLLREHGLQAGGREGERDVRREPDRRREGDRGRLEGDREGVRREGDRDRGDRPGQTERERREPDRERRG